MRNQVEFYQSLGKLFYAVAASDKNVRAAERAFLKEFINTQWTLLEDSTDEFYTAAAFQIEIVFDWYEENGVTSEESLTSFKTFKHNNPSYFTPGINQMIWHTAIGIADSFSGINKYEAIVLSKIQSLLNIES